MLPSQPFAPAFSSSLPLIFVYHPRFDAERIFAVAFSCNRIIPDPQQANRLPTTSFSQSRAARCKKLCGGRDFVGLKHHFVISRRNRDSLTRQDFTAE